MDFLRRGNDSPRLTLTRKVPALAHPHYHVHYHKKHYHVHYHSSRYHASHCRIVRQARRNIRPGSEKARFATLLTLNTNQTMTTQKQIRAAFWHMHPVLEAHALKWGIKSAPQNRHNADTRTAWVDFLDHLVKAEEISEKLASRATL